jgi:RNA polymerase sigma-70 factor, ECF subfamily
MSELSQSFSSGIPFEESEQLILRLKEGEEAAFTEAFELYRDLVYNLSYKLLADKAEAKDNTQEVFLVLFRKIHSFRGDASLKTWLYRVTFNQASNRIRWWRRRLWNRTESLSIRRGNGEGRAREIPSDEPGPERTALSSELQEALRQALAQLPFEQRAAVALRDVEGLTYEEIAAVVGVQVGTVKSRISRGRERLRELLQEFVGRGAI